MNRLLKGALALGAGAAGAEMLRRAAVSRVNRYQSWEKPPYREFPTKVLILGGGFAGYTAARTLCRLTRGREDIGIMVVSRENFFTFWPMLAGVISSDIDTQNVAQPLRRALIEDGASFRRAEVQGLDPERRRVTAADREYPYDHLVVALGGEPAYFGIPGVEEHAISMTGIGTAEDIRNRVIERFEEVTLSQDHGPPSKLTFVVIGGGATGVEVASELHELVHEVLAPDYPNIDPGRVRIILVDRNAQILKELDPALRRVARKKLADLKVDVVSEVKAREIRSDRVILDDGTELETENVVWAAGARASETLDRLGLPADERKGLIVDPELRVEGHGNIWGVGDCAANVEEDGTPVPPNAQAATQMGAHVAHNVLAVIDGGEPEPFDYKPLGQLVEMGSEFAVNEVLGIKFSGRMAALFWRLTYLYKLESPRSRARIAADWILDLFFAPAATQIREREQTPGC